MTADTTDAAGGRTAVRVRALPGVRLTPLALGHRRCHVARDPLRLRYFALEEPQRFALERMDGRRTLDEIRRDFEAAFKPQRLPPEEMEAFAAQLVRAGLAEVLAPAPGRRLFEAARARERQERTDAWLRVLALRVPVVRADALLTRLRPAAAVLFHPWAVALVLLGVLAGGVLVVRHWGAVAADLPTYPEFFRWQNAFYLWAALGLVKLLHELGHALCCKKFGGAVPDMGVQLLFFCPTLYCNVTDSWSLPSRWQRMAVAAAGVYVELILAVLAALLWRASDPAGFVHQFAFAVLLVCTVHTLAFNANPLLRFDGYFVLCDLLGAPNLADQAARRLGATVLGWFRGAAPPPRGPGEPAPAVLCLYAAGSLAYRALLTGALLYAGYQFLKHQGLPWLGTWAVTAAAVALLAAPARRFARSVTAPRGENDMRPSRVWAAGVLLLAGLLAFALLPLPLHVRGLGLVQVAPERLRRVEAPAGGGFLAEVCVRDGQRVRRGDVLAVLADPALELDRRRAEADRALRLEQQRGLAARSALLPAALAAGAATVDGVGYELRALAHREEALTARARALTLRAPADGVVLTLRGWEEHGQWLEAGDLVCRVGDPGRLSVTVPVEPVDRALVTPGARALVLPHGGGTRAWPGAVTAVAETDAARVPAQLAARAGGDVPTERDAAGRDVPHGQRFLATVTLDETPPDLQPGVLARVRVEAGSRTLWWRVRRFLGTTFHWGL